MPWLYQGREFLPEDRGDAAAFVYVIERIDTGRKYIGVKLFNRKVSKPPLKGKKRRRRSVTDSDWETYWGSNEDLLGEIRDLGEHMFRREIIKLCASKSEGKYEEARLQFTLDVLRRPDEYYNQFIGIKVHRSHLKKRSHEQ